jgi:ComF family protein
VAVVDYLSAELALKYVFGDPRASRDPLYTSTGYELSGRLGFWPGGIPLKGFFLKATGDYSFYNYKSDVGSASFGEPALGMLIGSQTIFGRHSGFTFSGGIGARYVFAQPRAIQVPGPDAKSNEVFVCGKTESTKAIACVDHRGPELIGQLAIGWTFLPPDATGPRGRRRGVMFLEFLGALLSPERCSACDEPVPLGHAFCSCCAVSVDPAAFPSVLPVPTAEVGAFGGALAQAIHRLKYEQRPDLARPLGDLMARAAEGLAPVDLVVPVPLAPARLRERGYNQAALLAARIARRFEVDHDPVRLQRVVETGQLAHQGEEERRRSVRGAFVCARAVSGRSVLLVDDVLTTGATLGACMEALEGARFVAVCVAARVERRDAVG